VSCIQFSPAKKDRSTMSSIANNKKQKTTDTADVDLNIAGMTREELVTALLETRSEVEKLKANQAIIELVEESDDVDSDADDCSQDSWSIKFKLLREYRIINGHCMVPITHSLGQWVNNQRRAYNILKTGKKGIKITSERINKLDSIGFFWGKKYPAPPTWNDQLEQLKKYKTTTGNCNIEMSPTSPSELAKWVSAQRTEFRHLKKGRTSLLSLEQIEELNNIGFNFKGKRLE